MSELTHLDAQGRARMVDVAEKPITHRVAIAQGRLLCAPATMALVQQGKAPKGNVIATAELAGVMAAKRTHDLIPLCHPLALTGISVTAEPSTRFCGFEVTARVKCTGQTGVEMEALTAVSLACLTLYDMLKAVDKMMVIEGLCILSKSGGKSGEWPVREIL